MKDINLFRGPDDSVTIPDINLHELICNAIDTGTIADCNITEGNIQTLTNLNGQKNKYLI